MELLTNVPLLTALLAIVIAQALKVPIAYMATRRFDFSLLTSTGSMPSSHSAAVSALTMSIGLREGFDSSFFAISAIFAVIVMFDATGIRYQAGQQAAVINQMRDDFQQLLEVSKQWAQKNEPEKRQELKTLLGHKPSEVLFGALTGIILALLIA